MDFITQRFIAIGNRLRQELRGLRIDFQQLIGTIHNANETTEQQQEQQRKQLNTMLAELQIQETAERNINARDERQYGIQVWMALATTLAFIAAAVYAGIAALQWRTMNKTYGEIQKQTPFIAQAATAAVTANSDARDRFRQDERPYIWLTNDLGQPEILPPPGSNPAEGGVPVWTWKFTNYGKSPAYQIKFHYGMNTGSDALSKPRVFGPWQIGAPLPPNKTDFDTAFRNPKITMDEFRRLMNTDKAIVIFGQFFYTDAYGGKYETGFCLTHLQLGPIGYCREGNYIK